MIDYPEAFNEKTRKARKTHKCCECEDEINKGDNYQYLSGIWDGEPSDCKQCLRCYGLACLVNKESDSYDEGAELEGLKDWFNDQVCSGFNIGHIIDFYSTKWNLEPAILNDLFKQEIDNQ